MTAKSKPFMPETIRPFVDKARERHKRRPPNPGVEVVATKAGGWTFGAPHRDLEAWEVQIAEAFGTRSESAYRTFLEQLSQLCSPASANVTDPWRPNERELNAALAIVSGMKPKNEIEAAHAAQTVAIHLLTMQTASKALQAGWTDHRTIAVAAALARTFSSQLDTMAKLKGRTGKQKISVKVERHIHHHEHQHLHTDSEGGGPDFGGQPRGASRRFGKEIAPLGRPDGPAVIEHGARPALPGPDAKGDPMPVPGGAGPAKVSLPRRGDRVRRPARRTERGMEDRGLVERGCRAEAGRVS